MTENELFQILTSDLSVWDKGKAIMELVSQKNPLPSALTLQPMKTRKPRTVIPKPKSPASEAVNGFAGHDETGNVA